MARVPTEIVLPEPELTIEFVNRLCNEVRRLADDNKRNIEEIEKLESRIVTLEETP